MFSQKLFLRPLAKQLIDQQRGLATLKDIRVRLNSVKNINITQSMKMGSAAKYARADKGLRSAIDFMAKKTKLNRSCLIELAPPTPAELPTAIKDGIRLFTKGNWRNVTIREAWLNALITTEVLCWFFVGECIGKGSIIGYQV